MIAPCAPFLPAYQVHLLTVVQSHESGDWQVGWWNRAKNPTFRVISRHDREADAIEAWGELRRAA